MARRSETKAPDAATPAPGNKIVRITTTNPHGIHSGLADGTAVHRDGEVVELPGDIAAILIARNCAVPADGGDVVQARKRAQEIETRHRQASEKSGAEARQRSFDDMPAELRALAREFGDEITSLWENGDDPAEIMKAYGR